MTNKYDEAIEILNYAMKFKLAVNAHKGDIANIPPEILLDRLRAEVDELHHAINEEAPDNILLEAADCCNFALSAAMNAIERIRNKKRGANNES